MIDRLETAGGREGNRGKSRQVRLLWARQAHRPAPAFQDLTGNFQTMHLFSHNA